MKGLGNEIEGPGGSHRRGYGTMFWRTREKTRQNKGAKSRLLRIEAMMWREGFTQNAAENGNGINQQRGSGDTETRQTAATQHNGGQYLRRKELRKRERRVYSKVCAKKDPNPQGEE